MPGKMDSFKALSAHDKRHAVVNWLLDHAMIIIILLLAAISSVDGHTLGTSLSAAIACVSNTGTGIELAGPASTFNVFSAPTKLFFCFGMLAGRLEIMPILLLFFPSVWSNR